MALNEDVWRVEQSSAERGFLEAWNCDSEAPVCVLLQPFTVALAEAAAVKDVCLVFHSTLCAPRFSQMNLVMLLIMFYTCHITCMKSLLFEDFVSHWRIVFLNRFTFTAQ